MSQRSAHGQLTDRQHDCLQRLAQGMSGKQIAADLGIAHSTVRTMLHEAYQRLGVNDRAQAVAMLLRREDGYEGGRYTTATQRFVRDADWLPTPAQRLYLDAFDVLLRTRRPEVAESVDFYFQAMCRERGCPDRRWGRGDVDSVLLGMGRAIPGDGVVA